MDSNIYSSSCDFFSFEKLRPRKILYLDLKKIKK